MLNLQTENFGAGLNTKTPSSSSHPPFLLLNKKTRGFRGSVGNIQRTHRADALWVPLKMCKKEGNQHFSAHETDSTLIIALVLVLSIQCTLQSGQYNLYLCFFICPLTKVKKLGNDRADIWTSILLTTDFFIHWGNKPGVRPWILG